MWGILRALEQDIKEVSEAWCLAQVFKNLKTAGFFVCLPIFEIASHVDQAYLSQTPYVAEDALGLLTIPPLPHEYWGYKGVQGQFILCWVGTQGPMHARQTLCQRTHTPSLQGSCSDCIPYSSYLGQTSDGTSNLTAFPGPRCRGPQLTDSCPSPLGRSGHSRPSCVQ